LQVHCIASFEGFLLAFSRTRLCRRFFVGAGKASMAGRNSAIQQRNIAPHHRTAGRNHSIGEITTSTFFADIA